MHIKNISFIRKMSRWGRKAEELEKFRVERDENRLDTNMESKMSQRYLWYWGSPAASMHFGLLIDTTDSNLFLLLIIREIDSFGRAELVSQFLENCWLLLPTRIWGNGVSFGFDKYCCNQFTISRNQCKSFKSSKYSTNVSHRIDMIKI